MAGKHEAKKAMPCASKVLLRTYTWSMQRDGSMILAHVASMHALLDFQDALIEDDVFGDGELKELRRNIENLFEEVHPGEHEHGTLPPCLCKEQNDLFLRVKQLRVDLEKILEERKKEKKKHKKNRK